MILETSGASGNILSLILIILIWIIIAYLIAKAIKHTKYKKVELLKEQNKLISEQNKILRSKED